MADERATDIDTTRTLHELRRILGGVCAGCGVCYTAHEAVWSMALGFKNAPRCFSCLCAGLARDQADLRRQLSEYVARHECYRRAWAEADRLEGGSPGQIDPPADVASEPTATDAEPPAADRESAAEWDAGPMGCGELVMELRSRLSILAPGAVLTVVATDPAAPLDIPAWCRMCGHTLVTADHPRYRIRRREA